MTIKGVIFDLGDTLMYFDGEWEKVHSRGVVDLLAFLKAEGLELDHTAFGTALHHQRQEAREVALATRVEYPLEASLRKTLAQFGYGNLGCDLLREATRQFFGYEESRWRAFPDAIPTLAALDRAGYRLGLISNASDDGMIQRLLVSLGLEPYLCPALNSSGVGIRKPDPQVFRLVLEEWSVSEGEAAMVGDTLEADILGAQLTGMRSILALMSRSPDEVPEIGSTSPGCELSHSIVPDASIQSLSQLPGLLARWQEGD